MSLFDWLLGRWSGQTKATLIYRRAMLNAKLKKQAAALADYTSVIEMPNAPAALRAMALYNRSLVHSVNNQPALALDDLNDLLAMPGAPADVRTEAKRKIARMDRTSQRGNEQRGPSQA